MRWAACAGMNPNLFFPEKEWMVDPRVTRACQSCVVRDRCLNWALETDQTFGWWGGLSEEQRAAINRTRSRVRCPDCRSESIAELSHVEICRACGLSWSV